MVQEADTVTYGASGSRTIRFRWISPSPRPAQVRVWMRAVAWYYHNGTTGYGAASDGLGGTTLVTNEGGTSEGFQVVTLNVGQDGVATGAVSLSATATQSSIYVGSAMVAGASVDAGCSLAGGIDARIVTITTENGGEALEPDYSNAVTANPNLSYTRMIDWWTWLELSTENDPAYNYLAPAPKPAPVTNESSHNTANWTIGIPAQYRLKTTVGSYWTEYEPPAPPTHTFVFSGFASSQLAVGEWHQWSDSQVVNGHQIVPKTIALPAPHVEDHKHYPVPGVLGKRVPNNISTPGSHQTISLVFGWPDGSTHTSIRNVSFTDEFRQIGHFPVLIDDQCQLDPVELIPWQAPGVSSKTITINNPTFEAIAIHAISAVANAATSFATLPGSSEDAFGLGALKQYALTLVPTGMDNHTIYRNEFTWHGERWALIQDPNTGVWGSGVPYEEEDLDKLMWKVLAKPKRIMSGVVMEQFGSSGFQRNTVRWFARDQLASIGPRLWLFKHDPSSAGGGTGGTTGGSQTGSGLGGGG